MTGLDAAIAAALLTADPRAKAMATRRVARDWRLGRLAWPDAWAAMPERPARPALPELLAPRHMPKRGKAGSPRALVALWHALAHIEFVAIDLALDMAGRFAPEMARRLGDARARGFTGDFLKVAADEAMHFALIDRHLHALGSGYGALPAHDGLWSAAAATAHDVAARLALVPMVLEARGLDVTPQTRARVAAAGDMRGARLLDRILEDEIDHVSVGVRHFRAICDESGDDFDQLWNKLVTRHFSGALKPPFNASARHRAGLPRVGLQTLAIETS